jgi:hypothetical protein
LVSVKGFYYSTSLQALSMKKGAELPDKVESTLFVIDAIGMRLRRAHARDGIANESDVGDPAGSFLGLDAKTL